MRNILIGLIIGLLVGFGVGRLIHKDNVLNLSKAVNSGGLEIDP